MPFRDTVERLKEVPGLGSTATGVILAEIGLDMSLFPSAGHLLSWAGFVPRLDESAGKSRSTRIRKGAPWLKPVLVQAAWGATRKKNSYFQAQFLRDLLPSLNSGQVVLPRHDRLVAQICGLERRTGRSGKDSIDHAPNGHDDLANAVAGAAAATRSKYRYDSSLDWVAGPDADAA